MQTGKIQTDRIQTGKIRTDRTQAGSIQADSLKYLAYARPILYENQ